MSVSETDKKSITRFLRFTPKGLWKWFWLKVTGREIVIEGGCRMCGRCCRNLNLSIGDRWIRKEKDFHRLLAEYPEYDRFRLLPNRAITGLLLFECTRVTEEGKCGDHDNRPDICREYPDPDLPFTGGILLDHCGYKFGEAPSFSRLLEKEKKKAAED